MLNGVGLSGYIKQNLHNKTYYGFETQIYLSQQGFEMQYIDLQIYIYDINVQYSTILNACQSIHDGKFNATNFDNLSETDTCSNSTMHYTCHSVIQTFSKEPSWLCLCGSWIYNQCY